ncbi:MAG: PSD1 and planctomycete cytochrome C domain-containing protein [Planctomycetia bacterium]|nr:PSD1 and planctomycete cytochrome C domain-containing protein [Planctomycetia bacterium]
MTRQHHDRRRFVAGRLVACCVIFSAILVLVSATYRSAQAADAPAAIPLAAANAPTADKDKLDPAALDFVSTKIKPLLSARCYECHSSQSKKVQGGLRLDSRHAILKGGESGPVVEPGKPHKSMLIDAVNYRGDYEMPPKTKMPEGEIALLTKWVEMGAPWPADAEAPAAVAVAKPFPLQERKANHWAWRAVTNPPLPTLRLQTWPRRDLDRFVLAKLETANMPPAPAADRRTLARRVYFDLTGLPPSAQAVDEFVADPTPTDQALEKIVDRLLASPQYGVRWARHWLDLMRFAESRGHEYDQDAANAWQYRDYVVRALNADVPYNDFVVEHLAGDLVEKPRLNPEKGFNESVLGTGFWWLGEWVTSPIDVRRDETDRIDNMVTTASTAFLGVTVGCARCHDHKFDAISTRDYYALAGFVQSSTYRQVPFETLENNRQVASDLWQARGKDDAALRTALAAALRPGASETAGLLRAALATRPGATVKASSPALPTERVALWTKAIDDARRDVQSPLGIFAEDPAARNNAVANNATQPPMVVDYGRLDPKDWWQDGFAFGPGPVRRGSLRLSGNAQHPVAGVELQGFAHRDPLWTGLRLAGGTENEPGELENLPRPGQTLCTPTFTIESGRLHYLVRGRGALQAVVGSHRMIYGPLHKEMLLRFDTGSEPRWVTHQLGRYKGLRAHIEFVPTGDGPMDVFAVADRAGVPPLPQRSRQQLSDSLVGNRKLPQPLDALADQFQALLLAGLDRMATGKAAPDAPANESSASEMSPSEAWVTDWMIRHPELFAPIDASAAAQVSAAAAALKADEDRLAPKIQKVSHTALAIMDIGSEDEQLLLRGNSNTPGGLVPRRLIEALAGPESPSYPRGSGRLQLARQMVDPAANPLIARVIVNRIWHHLFGRGIVPTVDNFGVLGQSPSHPELLDYLATRFVAEGWSQKRLIREIVTSRTYQMSSKPADPRAEVEDPNNVLLHRMNVRRLEGEAIRDAILSISGRLDQGIGGPSVPIHLAASAKARGLPGDGPLDGNGRRSLYLAVRRNFLSPMLAAFDTPAPAGPVGRRNVSNVPAQPLILLNDPFVVEQAKRWANAVLADQAATPEARIGRMYAAALSRQPEPAEVARARLPANAGDRLRPPRRRLEKRPATLDRSGACAVECEGVYFCGLRKGLSAIGYRLSAVSRRRYLKAELSHE